VSEETEIFHDPRTGFHDLKPIPPLESESGYLFYLLLLAVGLLICLLYAKSRRRRQAKVFSRDFLVELGSLEKDLKLGRIEEKTAASSLSLLVREWLSAKSSIDAAELTRKELESELVAYPELTPIAEPLCKVIRQCEVTAFSELDSASLASSFETAREVLNSKDLNQSGS